MTRGKQEKIQEIQHLSHSIKQIRLKDYPNPKDLKILIIKLEKVLGAQLVLDNDLIYKF